MVLARKQTTWLFVALAATVYGAVFFVTRAHTAALHAGAIGLGAACDLTITVPVLYYLLLVRPGHSSWMALVAVTLAGARAAGFLLSAAEQGYLPVALAGRAAGDLGSGHRSAAFAAAGGRR